MKQISMGIAGLMLVGIMACSSSDDGIPFIPAPGPVISGFSLPQTGQNTCYDMAGSPTVCGAGIGLGQDGDLAKGAEWPDARFQDNSDDTVTDDLTGLMWAKNADTPTFAGCTGGTLEWQDALAYVACLNQNNYLTYNDWRLPNRNELQTLISYGEPLPLEWLDNYFSSNWATTTYWTSSNYYFNKRAAWAVIFESGIIDPSWKYNTHRIWPVRDGGQGIARPMRTGQSLCYDPSGDIGAIDEIPCAGTGQDGELQKGVAWPNPRFEENSDDTITDELTNLIWAKDATVPAYGSGPGACAGGEQNWEDALSYVSCLNENSYLGHDDWRLPNIVEISSLVQLAIIDNTDWLSQQGFVLPQGHFNNYYHFWSSTTSLSDTTKAMVLNSPDGLVTNHEKSATTRMYIWPVRGGR
jgi:hypothetical protein